MPTDTDHLDITWVTEKIRARVNITVQEPMNWSKKLVYGFLVAEKHLKSALKDRPRVKELLKQARKDFR